MRRLVVVSVFARSGAGLVLGSVEGLQAASEGETAGFFFSFALFLWMEGSVREVVGTWRSDLNELELVWLLFLSRTGEDGRILPNRAMNAAAPRRTCTTWCIGQQS
jgi:hypothetical protein